MSDGRASERGSLVGDAGSAAAAAYAERIDVPGASVERVWRPAGVDELAEIVAEHHARSEALLVCGGRTRLDQANRAEKLAAAVCLDRLTGIDVFEPDEGVVHALAGTPIRALREAVAAEGWELPLDPPGEATTVGGTIASAAVGPRLQVFGRVADAVLGLELVGADGTRTKCGGRVVKNVTGYDMAKLYTGSFGSLAVVAGAWLRLRPQPAARLVLCARVPRGGESFEAARRSARASSVRAFVWSESPAEPDSADLFVELGGSEAAVAHDRDALLRAFPFVPGNLDAVDRLRDERTRAACEAAVAFRARVVPSKLAGLREHANRAGMSITIDVGAGIVTGRVGSRENGVVARPGRRDRDAPEWTLGGPAPFVRLRELTRQCGGDLRIEWMPPSWHEQLDVFGEEPGTRALVVSLKQRFDPRRILNPGRFVAGT